MSLVIKFHYFNQLNKVSIQLSSLQCSLINQSIIQAIVNYRLEQSKLQQSERDDVNIYSFDLLWFDNT